MPLPNSIRIKANFSGNVCCGPFGYVDLLDCLIDFGQQFSMQERQVIKLWCRTYHSKKPTKAIYKRIREISKLYPPSRKNGRPHVVDASCELKTT